MNGHRDSGFGGAFAGALLGALLGRKGGRRLRRVVQIIVAAPFVIAFGWLYRHTGSVVVSLVLLAAACMAPFALAWGVRRLLARPRRVSPRVPARATEDPQTLYRWYEPTTLPGGLYCGCGQQRRAGELVYVGISWDVQRRARMADRRSACWWNADLSGSALNYATRDAVEDAERAAIMAEEPRENVVHAGATRAA